MSRDSGHEGPSDPLRARVPIDAAGFGLGAFDAGPGSDHDALTVDLVARVRGGDSAAFGELYQRYHDELLFAVRVHLGPELRAKLESEDILQSVVVDAFRALPRVRAETSEGLRHYLHTMVVNKIRGRAQHFDADRRAGDVPLTPSRAAEVPDPAQTRVDPDVGEPRYNDSARYERLERALAALPEDMRRVILLRKIDGLASKEVALMLGKSDEAARKLYSRAMARLTILLGDDAPHSGDGTTR